MIESNIYLANHVGSHLPLIILIMGADTRRTRVTT